MTRKRADDTKVSGRSAVLFSTIGRYMVTLDSGTRARMEKKFDVCYTMAKQSIPFAKCSALHRAQAAPHSRHRPCLQYC